MHLGEGEAATLYAMQVRPELTAVLCAREVNAVGKEDGVGARSLNGAFAVGKRGLYEMSETKGLSDCEADVCTPKRT